MRFPMFCVACVVLAQTLPSCPPTSTNNPPPAGERGTIATSAAAPPTALPGERVTLIASASGENADNSVKFSWAQIGGPGVALDNADHAAAAFDAPSLRANSLLKFVVTTSNAAGDVGRAEAQVEVAGDPNFQGNGNVNDNGGTPGAALPIADAGESRTVEELETVFLDASGSTGDGLSYQWRQTGGPTITLEDARTSQARFNAPNLDGQTQLVLDFELMITDRFGRTSAAPVTITITPAEQAPDEEHPRVRMRTDLGNIIIEFDHTRAPLTVDNFLEYVDDGFYDNTIIHRVEPGFVIQGGGYGPGLVVKQARDPIPNESNNGLSNDRGTIAMARTSDLNSATSQFFINLRDNTSLNATQDANGYAVFGMVVQGMTVVDQIASQETESRNGLQNVPVRDVVVLSVDRIEVGPSDAGTP
jgi:peptidyl-prolyl cis-trans isomerase A (cyclophilin A)